MIDSFLIHHILKSLVFSYKKVFLVALAIFMGALISCAFLSVYFDLETKLSKELKAYGANVTITPKKEEILLADADLAMLRKTLKGSVLIPYFYTTLNLGSTDAVVLGTDFESLKIEKPFIEVIQGGFSLNDFDSHSAFLGVDLAQKLQAKVGDKIEVYAPNQRRAVFVLKGILKSNSSLDSLLIVSLEEIHKLTQENKIHYIAAVMYGSYEKITQITKEISVGNILAQTISSISLSEGMILKKIKALMFLVVAIVLVITSLSVNTVLSSIIFSRQKEIALNLVLGARKSQIFKFLGLEYFVLSLFFCILGSGAGVLIADFFGYFIFQTEINFRVEAMIISVVLTLLFTSLASFFPLKKILKIDLCKNLKGE